MAFLIMSMNKTPAFSDTSNTAFHLLLYWHVFKVSAHYKETTHFYCLLIHLGAGSLGVQQNREKTHIIPCYQTSDMQRVQEVSWAHHFYLPYWLLFIRVCRCGSLKITEIIEKPAHRTGAIMGALCYFYALSHLLIWLENNFKFSFKS